MVVTDDDALSILRKWCEERSSVRFQFETPSAFKGIFTGIILSVSEREILIGPSDFSADEEPKAVFSVSLTIPHAFEFKDSRAAETEEDREVLEKTMTFMIVIKFFGDDRCLIYELVE